MKAIKRGKERRKNLVPKHDSFIRRHWLLAKFLVVLAIVLVMSYVHILYLDELFDEDAYYGELKTQNDILVRQYNDNIREHDRLVNQWFSETGNLGNMTAIAEQYADFYVGVRIQTEELTKFIQENRDDLNYIKINTYTWEDAFERDDSVRKEFMRYMAEAMQNQTENDPALKERSEEAISVLSALAQSE